ncbi:hypothetical protein PR202_ga12600 [Eleusine coracana subsp. coracana]|uniref:CNNM transmembrane domain-containing protein n=1 Tax=Eleusine coracana subsp. coracana TaxID=191504 RepID=A0AAV5CCN6_ELECO|nr:hypothetical protein PR202_ga12600 [Eleusine coracana subsp. coracana]
MPATSTTSAASLLLAGGRLPRLRLQSLRASTKPPFRRAASPLLQAGARPRPLAPVSASALPLPVTASTPQPLAEEDGWVRVAAAVRRIAFCVACGMLATAWCRRALAAGAAAGTGAPGAVEAAVGIGGVALRGAWPRVLQVLQLMREQGLILAALLSLSAFFSMAETSITTLWPWKVRELAEKEPENGVFKMLRSDVTRFLTTILIGTTVVNIGATAIVTEAATAAMFGEAGVSAATGVMTVAILLLTEITPKSVAVHNATEVARFVVR